MSFLGVYQGVLFYIRSVQTILLLLVVPLFTALGRPLTLITAALPRFGRRLDAVIHSRTARILTFPAIPTMVIVLVPFVLYFSPWYAASMRSGTVRELTYLALLAPGFVFFWLFLRVDAVPRAYPYLVALWVSAGEVVGDAVLGLAILADQSLIAGAYYHALGRPWGPSLSSRPGHRRRGAVGARRHRRAAVPGRPVHPDDPGRRDRGGGRGRRAGCRGGRGGRRGGGSAGGGGGVRWERCRPGGTGRPAALVGARPAVLRPLPVRGRLAASASEQASR